MQNSEKLISKRIGISIILICIFSIALWIRLAPVISTPEKRNDGFGIFGDTHLYHRIAFNLYKGNGFSGITDRRAYGLSNKNQSPEFEPAITRGPVYPYFMFMVYKLLGSPEDMNSKLTWHKNLDRVRIVQCFLDAGLIFVVYFMTRIIFPASFWAGIISSLIYCFSYYNIYYTKRLMTESVSTVLLTCSLLFCYLGLARNKNRWWILSGSGFGLIVLNRPEYILFIPFFASYLFFYYRRTSTLAIKKSLIFVLFAFIVITPWTIRNYVVFKTFVPVASAGIGYGLLLGTFETNDNWKEWGFNNFPDHIFRSENEKKEIKKLYEVSRLLKLRGVIEVKSLDDLYKKIALREIRSNPLKCIKVWISRIPQLWYQNYIPRYLDKESSGYLFIFYFLFSVFAFISSDTKEKVMMAPVFLLFIYLTIIFLPLHVEPRYGVPIMPAMICLAGIGVWKSLVLTTKCLKKTYDTNKKIGL